MSSPESATKAPESDAMEDQQSPPPPLPKDDPSAANTKYQPSMISSSDTPAQTGASMGEADYTHCTSDRPLLSTTAAQPSGSITTLNAIETYISKPADYPSTPAKLLLLLTGGTGIHSLNNQLQADRFAAHGFLVVMPDQFAADPAPSATNKVTSPTAATFAGSAGPHAEPQSPSIIESIKLKVAETAKSFTIDMWLARQTPEKVLPRIHMILDAVRDEYADAIAHGGGIYGAGYCFGARYVLILAGEHPDPVAKGQQPTGGDVEAGTVSTGPILKCGAIAHGTLVTREDVKGVKVPMSLVCVQDDPLFPEDVLGMGRKTWAASEVEYEVKVYEGVPHGFAVVGEYEDQHIKGQQEKAWEQMLGWLERH